MGSWRYSCRERKATNPEQSRSTDQFVEGVMPAKRGLQVQQKRELETKEEATVPARVFMPSADIYENEDELTVSSGNAGRR